MKKIFISVGEISGDNYACEIVKRLKNYQIYAIAGPKMEAAGVIPVASIKDISVVGLTEALSKYSKIKEVFKKSVEILKEGVDLLVVVDFPGFNIKLIKEAKKLGIKTVYFISPQVWAWGKSRIKDIVENTDVLISILPFEEEIYKPFVSNKFKFFFVGHPLLDIVKTYETEESFKQKLSIPKHKKIIGLLAGSRESEVNVLLPIMLQSARLLSKTLENAHFVIPATVNMVEKVLEKTKDFKDLPLTVITSNLSEFDIPKFENPSYEVMKHSVFSIIASGTATLEAAIIGNPFILVYKVSPITYFIGKRLVSIPFLGLPNIIAGKEVVPELLQERCTPLNIANKTLEFLFDEKLQEKQKQDLLEVKSKLGEKKAIDKAAEIISTLLEKGQV
ncbi:lipid-A-disaccharide synthase [Sulfurihydrogenibium subterraneum]|uniref:lipid-A-disaccharide synthase n=1 Tax=Sulfurihydrogenibium subterraneum TaxID=171121 RepID=UPI00048C8A2A|nr:lipid-A-disaccharide synthase [Sulfurihydrogenibium subterraneum]